jgi:rod shape-determining protein MreC
MSIFLPARKNRIIFILLTILCVILITLNLRYEKILPFGKSVVLEIISPIQKFTTTIINPFVRFIKTINKLSDILEENKLLKEKINLLLTENINLKELERENRELRELLGSSYYEKFELKLASVIGRTETDWKNTIFIDKGKNHNIKINMSVISQSGLIGKVIATSKNFSEIRLINDPNSSVAAMIQKTRKTGVIQGRGDEILNMDLISKEAEVEIGDVIITSGLGGIFPKGILIGRVYDIKNLDYKLYKFVEVLPSTNFKKLEEVLIITNFTPLTK